MNIKLQKKNHDSLKKLTKVDKNNNAIIGEAEIYVRLEDVADNLLNNDATPLSEEVLNQMNWKDDASIEFMPLSSNTLPAPKEGTIQIICRPNGELWCIPPLGTKDAFPLGNFDFENFLKKYEPNFIQGKTFEFFVLDKEAKLFANRMRVGSIPTRDIKSSVIDGGTYIDMNNTGNIVMFINGQKTHEFTKDKVLLANKGSTMGISSKGIIKLAALGTEASIKLEGTTFSISSVNTKIEEAENLTKFNCFTDLEEASYGNQNFRFQFYPSHIRIRNVLNSRDLIQILQDGTIYQKGNSKVIDEGTINNYIQSYFDANFENKFRESYTNIASTKETLFGGCSNYAYYNIAYDSALYQIDFSDTQTGTIMSIYCNGNNLTNLEKVYKAETGYCYLVNQHYATDESEDDYISVVKYTSSGEHCGLVWIRGLYRF